MDLEVRLFLSAAVPDVKNELLHEHGREVVKIVKTFSCEMVKSSGKYTKWILRRDCFRFKTQNKFYFILDNTRSLTVSAKFISKLH